METVKSKIKSLVEIISGKTLLPLVDPAIHGHQAFVSMSPYKDINPVIGAPPLWPYLNLTTFQQAPFPNTTSRGIRASTYEFQGAQTCSP